MTDIRAALEGLGGAGLAGVLALVAATGIFVGAGWPLMQRAAVLEESLARARSRPQQPAPPQVEPPAARLASFYARFPDAGQSVASIGRIQAAARRAGLTLASGEYRLERRAGERLQRYLVVLPVRGSYAQVRAFVDGVLTGVPHAAIDDIELNRDEVGGLIDARLRLTIYLRDGS